MLELINRYLHGYVTIPVILACRKQGFFKLFEEDRNITFTELATKLQANTGNLAIALRLFESLNWIVQNEEGGYKLNMQSTELEFITYIPESILPLYSAQVNILLEDSFYINQLNKILTEIQNIPPYLPNILVDFVQGTVIVPLIIALKHKYFAHDIALAESVVLDEIPHHLQQNILNLLLLKDWISIKNGKYYLTKTGQTLLERAYNTATVASYSPMFAKIHELLFGDHSKIFTRDEQGHELHIDRTLNVLASGFQHERYFLDIEDVILSIFNKLPYEAQPQYIIDMGCGDGGLLKRIYEIIVKNSARGKVLSEYPLYMIGVDFNQKSLEVTNHTLNNIPHYTLQGDINDPQKLMRDLKDLGLTNTENSLHVRSFLDHDRPFLISDKTKNLKENLRFPNSGVYVDKTGSLIPQAQAEQSLIEHLGRWAPIVSGQGIIILEVHCLPPKVVYEYLDKNENLHFDAYHGFSMQQLIEAGIFILAAAEVGLFPNLEFAKRYPKIFPYTRITLNYFQKRDYTISSASKQDLLELIKLEAECWPEKLCASQEDLLLRLQNYPNGQFVIKIEEKIIGVIYTQRISDTDQLNRISYDRLSSLYNPQGAIVQLLGFNILPEVRDRQIADEILDFILYLFLLQGNVEKVVGVTRCKNYKLQSERSFKDYVEQYNKHIDPILDFHVGHGAKIISIIPNFRPEDIDNDGYGVLIEYNIGASVSKKPKGTNKLHYTTPQEEWFEENDNYIHEVYACIKELIPKKNFDKFCPTTALRDMGFDSLDLLELKTIIGQRFQIELDTSFFFEYTTPSLIAQYLHSTDNRFVRSEKPQTTINCTEATNKSESIAVIGMGCKFPGGINNTQKYLEVLEHGLDMITKVPKSRIEWNGQGLNIPKEGGYLDDIDKFDAAFFNISPREAEFMDPQQRITLETTMQAIENAGLDAETLHGTQAGVFIGAIGHDYSTLINKNYNTKDLEAYYGTGNSASIIAGRLSYILGLQGPSIVVDTACSSSLVSVHLACQSLRQKECNLALAGGISLILSPEYNVAFTNAGMLSPDSRCKSFDISANGYVRSEGCGVIVLKRLSDALAAKDNILAIIRSSAVNQDGASNGLTAPSSTAQESLIRSALESASIAPESISYIEAHGTGTSLGDPIEMKALASVYGKVKTPDHPLMIGSVKTNIGHTEGAAGIAGLIKTILALHHNIIPTNLHFTALNPYIEVNSNVLKIPVKSIPWDQNNNFPRRAGVSAFGFGGTNAHIIVEEAPQKVSNNPISLKPYYLLSISAKNPDSLRLILVELYNLLVNNIEHNINSNIEAIAYTLNVGRTHFNYRYALIASSALELKNILAQQIQAQKITANCFFNTNKSQINASLDNIGKSILKTIQESGYQNPKIYNGHLASLAELYIKGCNIDWKALHVNEENIKIELPTYQFLKERHWISKNKAEVIVNNINNIDLHPLVGSNISVLGKQRFKTILKPEDFYLHDHKVRGNKIFPAAAYLEAAISAGNLALEDKIVTEIRGTVWSYPLQVNDESQEITIALNSAGNNIAYKIQSKKDTQIITHGQGELICDQSKQSPNIEFAIESLKKDLNLTYNSKEIYDFLKTLGLNYGTSFQTLRQIYIAEKEILGYLELPKELLQSSNRYILHPSLLDGAFQSVILSNINKANYNSLFLPFTLGSCTIYQALPHKLYVYVKQVSSSNNVQQSYNIQLFDEHGIVYARLTDFVVRSLDNITTSEPKILEEILSNNHSQILAGYEAISESIIRKLRNVISEILKIDINNIDPLEDLNDYGFDSITFTELANHINDIYAVKITPDVFFENTSITTIVEYLIKNHNITEIY